MSFKSERPDTHCCQFRTKKKLRISISPPVILLRGVPLNIVIGHEVLCSIKGTN